MCACVSVCLCVYICISEIQIPNTYKLCILIHIHSASPMVRAPQPEETGLLGEQITLTFIVVHAAPLVVPEDIIWMFTPISGGDTRDLETAMDDRLVFSGNRRSLTIMNLKFDDDGEYTFQASNRNGQDSTTMRLIVDGML